MSGKAGELTPSYRSKILPLAPLSSPSGPTSRTWVARTPSTEGVDAMEKCQQIEAKMRATSKTEREQYGSSRLPMTLAGVSGTWFVWQMEDVGERGGAVEKNS